MKLQMGLIALFAAAKTAVALPQNTSSSFDNLPLSDIAMRTPWEEPFPYSLADCAHETNMGIAQNAAICHCWDTGLAAPRDDLIGAINFACKDLNTRYPLGPGGNFTYRSTSETTFYGKPIDIHADVWFAGKQLGDVNNEIACDNAAMPGPDNPDQLPHGFSVPEEACKQAFMRIVDKCENGGQGGYAADKCLIYSLDPNDRETGE